MAFTIEDFWPFGSSDYDPKIAADKAGDALSRSIAHTAATFGDDLVVALFTTSRCRVDRYQDNDEVSYTIRVATKPGPFAVYLQRNDVEPNVEDRVRRYAGPLLAEVNCRISIAPAIDFEPGWESELVDEYFRNGPRPRETTDGDTLSRLFRLPP